MRNVKLMLIVFIAYILQTTIIADFNILGVAPNLILVIVCGISLLFGSTVGGIVGFIAGILLDFNQGRAIGLYAFLCMYMGIVLGQFNKRFFKDNYLVAVIFIGISTFVYETVVYLFGVVVYSQTFSLAGFISNVMLSVLCNLIMAVIVYPILLKINIGVELDKNIFGK